MKASSRALLASTVVVAALGFAGSADAALVTVGPNLSGTYMSESCETECTLLNTSLTQPGAQVISPVNGLVVGWHVVGGTTPGTYRLRAVNPLAGGSYLFAAASAPVSSIASAAVQTFTATMPIAAGQAIALDLNATASIGIAAALGSYAQWEPEPAEGTSSAPLIVAPITVGFNAEVQPAPTITSLGTASGSTAGGTSVTIAGADLEGASAVSFGSQPASSFTVNSESQITAVAPAAAAGAVSLSVTTAAGKTTSSPSFVYVTPPPPVSHCVVPKLKGKKLKASKKAIKKAQCKLGTVKKKAGATVTTGKVVKQSRTPGTVLPVGAKVTLTIKP